MKVGGGRIIGEACHFIDFMTFMCGSKPIKVMASVMPDNQNLNDTMNIIVEFENGSTGVVAYYANGSKAMPKEYFEVFSAGASATITDFTETKIYTKGNPEKFKTRSQDKGQKAMIEAFFNEIHHGKTLIPMDEIFAVTLATFAALKSVQEGGVPVTF
jgi:predicted dehydrogenase